MIMKDNYNYNNRLRNFARDLRNKSTKAEIRLWCELLCKSKMGVRFLRQRPVDRYIADFMCKELRLIIEVDGYTHEFKQDKDKERDEKLYKLGFKTLRFPNAHVMKDIESVERVIRNEIEKMKAEKVN